MLCRLSVGQTAGWQPALQASSWRYLKDWVLIGRILLSRKRKTMWDCVSRRIARIVRAILRETQSHIVFRFRLRRIRPIRTQSFKYLHEEACSAGCQPAVWPTDSRQSIGYVERLQIANLRYGELPVCSTGSRPFMAPTRVKFLEVFASHEPVGRVVPRAPFRSRPRPPGGARGASRPTRVALTLQTRREYNHGWTRMDTDKRRNCPASTLHQMVGMVPTGQTRSHPCPSVVKTF